MTETDLVFLPWVRRGAAAAPAAARHLRRRPARRRHRRGERCSVNNAAPVTVPRRVMGPGHVTGLDRPAGDPHRPGARVARLRAQLLRAGRVRRAEPAVAVHARGGAGAEARLRPWLCLVVVRKQDGVRLDPPALRLAAGAAHRRPGDARRPSCPTSPTAGRGRTRRSRPQSDATPSLAVRTRDEPRALAVAAPLLRACCTRTPTTSPASCPPSSWAARPGSASTSPRATRRHLAPAWDLSRAAVELPVYYSWDVRDRRRRRLPVAGDAAARRGRCRPASACRPIDVSESGLAVAVPAARRCRWPVHSTPSARSTARLAAPDVQTSPGRPQLRRSSTRRRPSARRGDPLLAPPLYGGAQAGLSRSTPAIRRAGSSSSTCPPASRAVAHLGHARRAGAAGRADGVRVGAGRRARAGQPAAASGPARLPGGEEHAHPPHRDDGPGRRAAGARARRRPG